MAGELRLDTPVQFLKGVGPARAQAFEALGIQTVADLLSHFPFRYEEHPASQAIGTLELGRSATVIGQVRTVRTRGRQRNASVTAVVEDATGRCRVTWFHSPHLSDRIQPGQVIRFTGKVDAYRDQASFANPPFTLFDEDEDPFAEDHATLEPVYRATAELPSRRIRRIVGDVLASALPSVDEIVTPALRSARNLPPRRTAMERMHRPTAARDVETARRCLAYEELLLLQLAVQGRRNRRRRSGDAIALHNSPQIDERIRKRLPFALTAGQEQAVSDLCADLAGERPMNRLLQADVGAGKTAVAVYASLVAVANRQQVAVLAPTEVLAEQHYRKFMHYLTGSRVRIGYLTGSTSSPTRRALLAGLAAGDVDVVIGTHALLNEDVKYARLALVVVDEQHRFGVTQRAALRAKGRSPHYLVLTATPIPRTLAMTLFGDLDTSVIQDMPPGRGSVTTNVVSTNDSAEVWRFVRSRLAVGERAFVVYPLVEASADSDLKDATTACRRLQEKELAGINLGMLHGRMNARQKQSKMQSFADGRLQVLVATTVIEVGIDVPEATMMLVMHADRYGLSQLHQLRGRIGRGGRDGHCFLFADSPGDEAAARLGVLARTRDGFEIAEEDLRIRGPGELIGKQQHGMPAFRVADLCADVDLIVAARDDAAGILRDDPSLTAAAHQGLRRALLRQYGPALRWVDVA